MAKIRRIIRKLRPQAHLAFDDQFWPVAVALLVLGAYASGVILAILPFDEPRLYLNAITYLCVIPVLIGAAMWGLSRVPNHVVRRGVQLAAVLSMITHLTILLVMFLFGLIPLPEFDTPASRRAMVHREEVVLPDYHPSQIDPTERPQQDFERPVETQIPEPTPEEVERQPLPDPEQPQDQPVPEDLPEPQQTVQPNVIERATPVESAPRQSEQQSQLSRQVAQAELRPATPIATPQVTTHAPRQPSPLEARQAEPQRQSAQAEAREVPTEIEPSVTQPQPVIQMARRAAEAAPRPETQSAPTLPRQLAEAQTVPRTDAVPTEQASPTQQTTPEAVRPQNVAASRQITESPQVVEAAAEPAPTAPTQVSTQLAQRQHPADEAPSIAQMPQRAPTERTVAQVRPDVATVVTAASPTTGPVRSANPQLQPSEASVSRQPAAAATGTPSFEPQEVSAAAEQVRVAAAPSRRAVASPEPTIHPDAPAAAAPMRSTRTAEVAASSTSVAAPAVAVAGDAAARPSHQPARTSLDRGLAGTAGIGQSANLDREAPAPERTALVASGSAQRQRATQDVTPGPAIAPSSVPQISRSRAGAEAPSSAYRAEPVEIATHAGAEHAALVQASASAALSRAGSNVPVGQMTAAVGQIEIDLGPTRIVSESGGGRASGGGQPTINFEPQLRPTARSGRGGGPSVTVAANVVADLPEAPEGQGGGAPPTRQIDAEATAATRSDTGDALAALGGPAPADLVGEPALASNAEMIGESQVGRTQAAQAAPGITEPGGGTRSPTRASTGPQFTANTRAEVIAMSGAPESGGAAEGVAFAATGTQPARSATGIAAPATDGAVGALAAESMLDAPATGAAGMLAGRRQTSPADADGPVVAELRGVGGPLRRSETVGVPVGLSVDVETPFAGAASPEPPTDLAQRTGGADAGNLTRQMAGAIPVSIEAVDGPGGLGTEVTLNVGTNLRRSQSESPEIHFRPARFIHRQAGGMPGINATAQLGAAAFDRRARREGDPEGGGPGRPSAKTEEAIELGLRFLARHQMADGSWSLNNFGAAQPDYEEEYVNEQAAIHSDTAATALALLAFLGAGYHHKDDVYRETVRSALEYLIKHQKENGDLYLPMDEESNRSAWLYSHGLATIALCEAYGMTQDPWLRQPAQKAIDFTVASQHAERGGWRYAPNFGADTSVTGWLMMALKSGQLANLEVPNEAFERIERWLDLAQASPREPHLYSYNPLAPDTPNQRHGRLPNKTMTSVGLLMRLYTGWRRGDEAMIRGAEYLLENLPAIGSARDPQRDTYYWYYATQVMYHMGDKYWETWNDRLHPLLVDTQIQRGTMAGSWDPRRPIPDRWGPHAGRIYVTCMNLLSLEVYYRHLPIYEETLLVGREPEQP